MASTHKSLRSGTANKRPTTSIADGQIALNTNVASPGLYFKDSTGASIIKIGPVHVGTTAPNVAPAGSSGNSTGEAWLDTSLTPNGWKVWTGAAWTNATPVGSDTVQGLLELATNAETQAGSDTARAVTPAGLQSKVSDSTSTTSSTTIASSTAVKSAYDLANAALPKSGGTVTGNLEIGTSGSLTFEGATADAFETTLAVVDPTADRTITLPNVTGTVVTTGDTGTVTSTMILDGTILNADVNASAAIAGTKISPDFGSQNAVTTGTSTAASFIPTSSTVPTNGVYLPAANNVAISTNGTGRLFVNSSGQVGIGATPDATLTVDSGATGLIANLNSSATNGGYIVGKSSGTAVWDLGTAKQALNVGGASDVGLSTRSGFLAFGTASAERLRITSAGLVGVGTSSPAAQFVVGSGNTLLGHNTLDNYGGRVDIRSAYQARSANVPAQLFVADSAGSQLINTGGAIDLGGYQDSFSRAYSYARIQGLASASTGYGGYLSFMTQNAGGSIAECLRIDSSGRLGIGTSSPGSYWAGVDNLVIADSGDAGLAIKSGTGNYGTIAFTDTVSTANEGYIQYDHNLNSFKFGTNSTNALFIDSSQRVGIGTSSPSFGVGDGLEVARSGVATVRVSSNTQGVELRSDGGTGTLETRGAFPLVLGTGGTERARIDSSGRLGIGTASPGHNLEIKGSFPDFAISDSDTANDKFRILYNSGSTQLQVDPNNVSSGSHLLVSVDNTERARIDSSGRLLVGTSSASTMISSTAANLQVQSTGTTIAIGIERATNDANPGYLVFRKTRSTSSNGVTVVQNGDAIGNLSFTATDGTAPLTAASVSAAVDGTPGTNDMPGRLVFSTTADGAASPTERLRIDSSGRVGIGTTSPSVLLHVSGGNGTTFKLDAPNDYSSTASILMNQGRSEIRTTINASGGNPGGSLFFRTRNNAGSLVDAITINDTQTVTINSAAGTNPLIVGDGGIEAMRVDSVGRLLVGTSTSLLSYGQWVQLPVFKLQVHQPSPRLVLDVMQQTLTRHRLLYRRVEVEQSDRRLL
jgi:hypothetical protein